MRICCFIRKLLVICNNSRDSFGLFGMNITLLPLRNVTTSADRGHQVQYEGENIKREHIGDD